MPNFHGINQGLLTTLAVFGIPGRIGTLPEIVVIFVEETVSENQRSGWMVHSIGVFVTNIIGSVTTPLSYPNKVK